MNDQELAISKQNKLLYVMIIMNILFVLMIFYLLLRDKNVPSQINSSETAMTRQKEKTTGANPVLNDVVPDTTHGSETGTDEIKDDRVFNANEAISEFVGNTVATTNDSQPDKKEPLEAREPDTANTVTVYYDGKLLRMEETDDEGNQHITISNSLEEIGELSKSDASYVKALEELKRGTRSHMTIRKTTAKEATTYKAKQVSEEQSVDYFNKVDVSKVITQPKTEKPSVVTQIAKIVSEPERTAATEGITSDRQEDSYIHALKTESIERSNEMRTVQVVKGDSLWVIANRAYGSGYEYPRIFEANPHLTDPDKLKVGDSLRVPL